MGVDHTLHAFNVDLPPWVASQLLHPRRSAGTKSTHLIQNLRLEMRDAGGLALCSCVVEDAVGLDRLSLRRTVENVYRTINDLCETSSVPHAIRYWNFIPAIHEVIHDDLDRYKVFNLGRHDAVSKRLGRDRALDGCLATATAVGHDVDSLVVHCLAASSAPVNIENPRQIPAYRYSPVHGPQPPCFSRASRVSIHGQDLLLVGGTSSVRGEDSVHRDDCRAQLGETLKNLLALVVAGLGGKDGRVPRKGALARFKHVRAYFVQPEDATLIARKLRSVMPNVDHVELVRADICRAELCVEIEGVVDTTLSAASVRGS